MPVQASGTFTFLFTDIVGSTALAQQYPDAMPSLLARHHRILNEAISANHGRVFQIIGDAFCALFHTASDALNAALAAQRRFQQEDWSPVAIQVRMGIHTGEASPDAIEAQANDTAGYLTLTRVQRIMASAHGGQILLSSASLELVRGQSSPGVSFRDLGEHPLKGLDQPERLWQIVAPGITSEFPALPAVGAIPNNLPVPLTSFIGREREIDEIKNLLGVGHLVTLIGPGGSGKTRLSLQVAAGMMNQFADGAWLVELASLGDSSLVPNTVGAALGVHEIPGLPVIGQLTDFLRPKKLLLVLDNCEHLIAACGQLVNTLLHQCPELRMLASSREALNIAGETSYPVLPLDTPGLNSPSKAAFLRQYESVRLFVERAQTMEPRFVFSDGNAEAVAKICRRLDGIPLAIELAAARIKVFAPEQIVARLDDRFRLLTGGSRSALPRQQTLRALIEWSYDLLALPERALLRRLSVFAGGWTFDAAESVCAQIEPQKDEALPARLENSPLDVLEALTQLVNKSLVVADVQDYETRYRFLETIRQFAHDKLIESGEAAKLRSRHLEYYLALAQRAEPQFHGADQLDWFRRMDAEEDNLRAAQNWALESNQAEKALNLAGSLWWYWYTRDHFDEAQERMGVALARSTADEPGDARLKVMNGLGFFLYAASKLREARALLEEAVRVSQQMGSRRNLAESLQFLGAVEFVEAARTAHRQFANVHAIMEQSLALWQELGDKTGISWELNLLASLSQAEGDLTRARMLWEESVALRREIGDRFLLAYTLRRLADTALLQGDFAKAEAGYREGYGLLVETGGKAGIAANLAGFAGLALSQGQVTRAVRLFSAVQSILQALAWRLPPADDEGYQRNLARAREQLDPAAFEAAWAEGGALTLEQAITYALSRE